MRGICNFRCRIFIFAVTVCVLAVSQVYATDERSNWPSSISILTKGAGGSSYGIGAGLARLITKKVGVPATVEPAAGSQAEIEVLRAKKGELAFITNMEAYLALHGKGYWEKRGMADIREITSGSPLRWGIVVRKDSKIFSPTDLAGKRVFAYLSGSSNMKRFAELLWEAYGIEGKVREQAYTLMSEAKDALKEKRISAFIYPAIPGTPALVELSTTIGIRFLPITGKESEHIEKEPSFGKMVIPAKSFPGQDEEVPTLGFYQDIFCRTDLPESLVYAITKTMYENFDEWLAVHKMVKYYDLNSYFDNPVIPFHAGAVKYYKEKGLWGEKQERVQMELLKSIGKEK